MKREATQHTKMGRLEMRLGVEKWGATGILELLWHLTAREAPAGNIGKLPNEDIAYAIGWKGDANLLIDSLLESGWLDRNQEHRVIIHDWSDHADDAVHVKLCRRGEIFCDGTPPKVNKLPKHEREEAQKRIESAVNAFKSAVKYFRSTSEAIAKPSEVFHGGWPEPTPEPEPVPEPYSSAALANTQISDSGSAFLDLDEDYGESVELDGLGADVPLVSFPWGKDAQKAFLKDIGWGGPKRITPIQWDRILKFKEGQLQESTDLNSLYMIWCRISWFQGFWEIYWRKKDKKKALVAFFDKVYCLEDFDRLFDAAQAEKPEMLKRTPEYQPSAAAWINKESWRFDQPPTLDGINALEDDYDPLH